ncbi:hypothetical protein AW27_033680 (plasmid) [Streptomyces sp. PCS3-D2]|uniref:hypothetical protein n=1 Tax=Streptomyces sp. PCS3-D2 TaxID=1460244 RepID=UPI000445849B|nr:hypothetical protein [Streptomyces sp. PCS3-D2]WKV76515.1 hypothetical protein AW27_033680 [Streptomyces sp. PCS3-D2]
MNIHGWYVWITLGLAALQVLGLVPIVRRLRGDDRALRSQARLELLETFGTLILMGGLLLSLTVAESWFWLAATGFALMAADYAVQGIRRLRTRRHMTS